MIPLHTECLSHNYTRKQTQGTLKLIPPLPSFLVEETSHRTTSTHILQYCPVRLAGIPWIWCTLFNWEATGRFWGSSCGSNCKLPDLPSLSPEAALPTFSGIPSSSSAEQTCDSVGSARPRNPHNLHPAHTHRARVTAEEEPWCKPECITTKRNPQRKLEWT